MAIWWILGGIAVLLLLILLLRVGLNITFGETLCIVAKIGPVKIPLVPAPEKKIKQTKIADKSPEAKEKKPNAPEKKAECPTFREIRQALPVFLAALKKALQKTRRRMRVDPMQLSVIFGGDDPAQLAQVYGWANTAMWTVMPQLERLLQMPDPHIHLEADFESKQTHAEGAVGISFHIGDLLSIALTLAVPVLRWYLQWKKKPTVNKEENTQTA